LATILFLTQGGQAIAALGIVLIPADSVPVILSQLMRHCRVRWHSTHGGANMS